MKNSFKIILCFAFFTCFVESGMAQKVYLAKGYYLTKSGDSINGYFDLNDNQVRFSKQSSSVDMQVLTPFNISKIYCQSGEQTIEVLPFTVVAQRDTEEIFIFSAIYGKINLYRGKDKKNDELFLISCEDRPEIRRINKYDPKAFLFVYFDKCDKLGSQKEVAYTLPSLLAAIKSLKACKYAENEGVVKINKLDTKFSMGINVGLLTDKSSSTGWFEGNYKIAPMFLWGIAFKLNLGNRFSIGTGLNFSQRHWVSDGAFMKESFERGRQDPTVINFKDNVELKCKTIELPVEVSWRLYRSHRKYMPIISVGSSLFFYNNLRIIQDFTGNYYQIYPYSQFPPIDVRNPKSSNAFVKNDYQLSPFISLSILKSIGKHSFLRVGIKSVWNSNATNSTGEYSISDRISYFDSKQIGVFGEYTRAF
jgi:hypothetical protein